MKAIERTIKLIVKIHAGEDDMEKAPNGKDISDWIKEIIHKEPITAFSVTIDEEYDE